MRKLANDDINGDFLTIENAARRTNMSMTKVKSYAKECGAWREFGASRRIYYPELEKYLMSDKFKG